MIVAETFHLLIHGKMLLAQARRSSKKAGSMQGSPIISESLQLRAEN